MSRLNDRLSEYIERDIREWDELTRVHGDVPFERSFPGHRRTGTPGDRATDAWLLEKLSTVGLSGAISTYPFERFDIEACWIEVNGEHIPAVPMYDTKPQHMDLIGTLGEDVIALPCAPQEAHPATQSILAARTKGAHRAIIAYGAATTVEPGLALVNAESYQAPVDTPVFQVSSACASKLTAGETVRCCLVSRKVDAEGTNVICHVKGTSGTRPWVVMTPKSAWWTSTAERAGGIVAWLALARRFATRPPRQSIIFTANSGHELSHLGMDHFLEQINGAIGGWLHLGANFASGSPPHLQTRDRQTRQQLIDALAEQGLSESTWTDLNQRPLGEARNIYDRGEPYFSILGGNQHFHHPDDRYPQTVDLAATVRITRALLALMEQMLD